VSREYTEKVIFNNEFSLYELQRCMESAATVNSKMIGLSREELIESNNACWVLLRIKISLDCDVKDIKELDVTTWHYKSIGVMWYRGYDFVSNGKKIGSAVSAWAIVDVDTHRILRPNHIKGHEDSVNLDHGEPEALKKVKVSDDLVKVMDYTVVDEDIDINGHMNNARYTRIAEKVLEVPSEPFDFEIDYVNEAKKDEVISLSSDGASLHGRINDKDCFAAKITVK